MPQQAHDKDLLLKLLTKAINKCYDNDKSLIERSMERACVSRIFLYMHELIQTEQCFEVFKEYDLDCEYNKNGEHIKDTPRCKNGTSPDLILHKRKYNNRNLLVVEFKSANGRFRYYDETDQTTKDKKEKETDKEVDFVKLEDFTVPYVYNYFLGIFVRLKKKKVQFIYFQHGKKIEEKEFKYKELKQQIKDICHNRAEDNEL